MNRGTSLSSLYPMLSLNGSETNSTAFNWWIILIPVIYLIVAIPSTIKFIINCIKINNLGNKSTKQEVTPKGYRLLYVPLKILSFSFLNKIFLSDLFPLKPHEKNTIITHEEYHLTEKHSIDIIITELIRILLWFNPVIILIQKIIKENHEFLADKHTINLVGKNDYTRLLKSFKWQEINMMVGSGYSGASIKNRLKMIHNSNKKNPIMKKFILCIITLFTVFIFACEDDLKSLESNSNKQIDFEISDEELQQEIQQTLKRLKNAPDDLIEEYVNLQQNNPHMYYMPAITVRKAMPDIEKLKKTNTFLFGNKYTLNYYRKLSKDEAEKYSPSRRRPYNFILESYEFYAYIKSINRAKYFEHKKKKSNDVNIYDVVDKSAKFGGGIPALSAYLKSNLKYPNIAKEKRIEDKLVMRFVVGKGGGILYLNVDQEPSITNEKISIEFQKSAFRVLQGTSGMWIPAEKDGKYVMSRMTLPIEFKLD